MNVPGGLAQVFGTLGAIVSVSGIIGLCWRQKGACTMLVIGTWLLVVGAWIMIVKNAL